MQRVIGVPESDWAVLMPVVFGKPNVLSPRSLSELASLACGDVKCVRKPDAERFRSPRAQATTWCRGRSTPKSRNLRIRFLSSL